MKLSLWTCRSKNSWVLYSYREVSETFHFYFTLKCSALKADTFCAFICQVLFWKFRCSGLRPRVVGCVFPGVLNVSSAVISRVEQSKERRELHTQCHILTWSLGTAHPMIHPHLIFRNSTLNDTTSPDLQEQHTQWHILTWSSVNAHPMTQPHLIFRNSTPIDTTSPDLHEMHTQWHSLASSLGTAHLKTQPRLIFTKCTPNDTASPHLQELHTQWYILTWSSGTQPSEPPSLFWFLFP